jgi:hypothetical protein
MSDEIEVFRIIRFDKNKYYAYAMCTRKEGYLMEERYFTTNALHFLGRHVNSERWRQGDGGGGAENFVEDDGARNRVIYDYDGKTCFREVNNGQ